MRAIAVLVGILGCAGGQLATKVVSARLRRPQDLHISPVADRLNNVEEEDEFEVNRDFQLAKLSVVNAAMVFKLPPSCKKSDLVFTRFPLSYVNGRDYFTGNYLDLDKDVGERRDYRGKVGAEARNYDGHKGIDVSIPSFRQMDDNTAKIRSASPGVVTFVRSDQPDRNIGVWCPDLDPADRPKWNVVVIEAPNGFKIMYGHMKRNSPTVKVGDKVSTGQVLGVVGSSGCSTGPHLHFEVHDCDGKAVETFASSFLSPDMWSNPIAYEPAANIMDVLIKRNRFADSEHVSPPLDRKLFAPGNEIGIAFIITFESNDVFELKVYNPDGLWWTRSWDSGVSDSGRMSKGRLRWYNTIINKPGRWRVEARCNGVLRRVKYFDVSNYSPYKREIVVSHILDTQYQATFDDVTAAGYRPHLIDGYKVGASTYINAVFRKYTEGYRAYHGLTSAQYQQKFDSRPSGYRPISTQSYLRGGSVRYALIFKQQSGGAWTARHGKTEAEWNTIFNNNRDNGYSPLQVSVVSIGGKRYYTTYWEKKNIGSWYVHSKVLLSAYQGVYDAQAAAGRRLLYADAYVHNGNQYVSVIFASSVPAYHEARHGITQMTLNSKVGSNNAYPVRRLTQVLSGYSAGSSPRYVACWFRD